MMYSDCYFFFEEPEISRSRSHREDIRTRTMNSRQAPYHHSHSTSSAGSRASKMQSHILRRLTSMRTSGTTSTSSTGNSAGSSSNSNTNRSSLSTIDRILFDQMIDLSSIPIDLSTGMNKRRKKTRYILKFGLSSFV